MEHSKPVRGHGHDVSRAHNAPAVAVVGAGHWGGNLVRNFEALGVLRTICDSDTKALARQTQVSGEVARVTSYSEVLEDHNIRGVVIATPAAIHAQMVREALLAGKDVLVEKPLCLDERAAAELCELAERHARVLMVGHLLWYHPAVLKIQEMVHQGQLGRLQYVYSNRLNLGRLRREENVLWSFAPHDISVILGLVNEFPELVQAGGGNFLHRRIADTTVSLLEFPSGVRAHVFVSWLHPFKEQKLVLVGDKQMVVFDDTADWGRKVVCYPHRVEWNGHLPTASKADAVAVPIEPVEPLRNECQHFVECMTTRNSPRTDGREGLRVLQVLNACQVALGEYRAVPLQRTSPTPDYFVHGTALLDPGAEIGPGTRIWHFSHVLEGSVIGRGCSIGQNVVIGPNVSIGDGCKIQNNVSIYEGVTLEEDVFCGPSMVFTNVMNPRAAVSRKHQYLPTRVGRGCTIGANSTIVCGNTLGRYSFIGAGAVVTRDVPEHALVVGNPARRIGWMCSCGERLGEDLHCLECGAAFKSTELGLERTN